MAAVGLIGFAQLAVAGPDWVEDGDAGSQLQTAQPVTNVTEGTLVTRIRGRLEGSVNPLTGIVEADFEDMYQITIVEPSKLVFSTQDTSTNFQTSLWLFDANGNGLLGNVIAPTITAGDLGTPTGSLILNFSTDDTGILINKPGIYYICISSANRRPQNDFGPLFLFSQVDEISGPDNEGGFSPLAGWFGEGEAGDYELLLQGVGTVPAPGALALLGISAIGLRRRRR